MASNHAAIRRELDRFAAVANEAALQAAVAASAFAVFVADDSGRFVDANRAAAELTGYSERELRKMSVWQITPDVHEREAETLWLAFLQQHEQSGTYRILHRSGRTLVVPYAARTNVQRGRHISVLG